MTREPDARDARVAYAALTDTGRTLLRDMRATAERVADEVFAAPSWNPDDIALFAGLTTRLGGTGLTDLPLPAPDR